MSFSNPSTASFQQDTDANFRLWVAAIAAALAASGLVQTADSGQVDVATVLKPAAGGSYPGYQIWRFNDALQGANPVFFKIEYGAGASQGQPAIAITVGTGSNGAGTITNIIFARTARVANSAATSSSHAFSGDTNRFGCVMAYNQSYSLGFFIERTHDNAGADTAYGVLVAVFGFTSSDNAPGTGAFATVPFAAPRPPLEGSGHAIIPDTGSTIKGANIGFYPGIWFDFGEGVNPPTSMLAYRMTDIGAGVVVPVNIYGANHNYLPLGRANAFLQFTSNNAGIALRYE